MRASALRLDKLILGLALVIAPACGGGDDDTGTPTAGRGGTGGASGGSGGSGGSPPNPMGGSGGSGGSAGMAGGAGGAMGGSGGMAGGAGGAGGAMGGMDAGPGAVTWTNDIKPIFEVKCHNCHTQLRIGHNLGASYADAMKEPVNTMACGDAETVGACTIIRIKAGQMPQGKNCSGNPEMDADNDACLTAEEQATVQAWIDGGLLE